MAICQNENGNNNGLRAFGSQFYLFADLDSTELKPPLSRAEIDSLEYTIKVAAENIRIQPKTLHLVFHILYTDDRKSVKENIKAQVSALNRDFSNKSFINNHPNDPEGIYTNLATDSKIKFVAKGNGQIVDSDGIGNIKISEEDWRKYDDMKKSNKGGFENKNPGQFINIWVTKLPDGISSYASSIHRGLESNIDGIVLDARFFELDPNEPYGQGKTLTHLMGNYLGLYDLWSEDRHCLDDYVDDTPIHNAFNYGKPSHKHVTTCPQENGALEMVMNFMDNSDDELQTMFTEGQVRRMHTVLTLVRKGLIHN